MFKGLLLKFDEKALIREIKLIANECRLQSKGSRPGLALMRAADSLSSIIESLSVDSYKESTLTKREREILFHVSQGFTNREIASALSISEKTIEFHMKAIFQKTEASTRTEAVTNAIKNQWLILT